MALCEVAYADVLNELFDEAAVLCAQWQRVSERVRGVVRRVILHRDHYAICEGRVKGILHVLVELWETARQSSAEWAAAHGGEREHGMALAQHSSPPSTPPPREY